MSSNTESDFILSIHSKNILYCKSTLAGNVEGEEEFAAVENSNPKNSLIKEILHTAKAFEMIIKIS